MEHQDKKLTLSPVRPSAFEAVWMLFGHTSWVNILTIAGETICSGSYDKTVWVWDIKTGKHLRTLEGHTWGVWLAVAGELLLSESSDGTIRVWNLGSCESAICDLI